MQTKHPAAALVIGAALIAVIAAVTGWSIGSRHVSRGTTPEAAADIQAAIVPTGSLGSSPSRRISSMRAPGLQGPRSPLVNKGRGISESVATARKMLKSRFDAEPVDAAWAARKQTALAAASDGPQIDQLGAKPLAFDSRCRSSVCLVGADFASATAADDWFSLYTMLAGPEMSRAAVQRSTNPDGTIHLQIYGQARK